VRGKAAAALLVLLPQGSAAVFKEMKTVAGAFTQKGIC